MRVTLTLDPDVARLLGEEVHRSRNSLNSVVNEALRRGLSRGTTTQTQPKYRISPHMTTLRPGFAGASFNTLIDELEAAPWMW